jgi:hypothetical protein
MATIDYQEMMNALGYTHVQKKHKEIYDVWANEPIVWYFPLEDLAFIIETLSLENPEKDAVIHAHHVINHDPKLFEIMSFIQNITMIKAHPSDWLANQAPLISHETLSTSVIQLMAILSLIPLAKKDYESRGIDQKHRMFNLNHLKGYIKNYRIKHHDVGIELYGWTTYLASLGLIHLGSLHFMHHKYSEPFIFYRHKTTLSVIAFALEGIRVRQDGQLDGVNGKYDLRNITSYIIDQDKLTAYPIHPKGWIDEKPLTIDLKDYDCILKPGDVVIDFHIPTRSDYTLNGIRHSFEDAIQFFQKHYHEYDYQAFWCTSWLYSPQIDQLITKPTSNILTVAEQGYILPATPGAQSLYTFVFQTEQPDFNTIKAKTSLEQSVIDYIQNGHSINAGCYLYFIKDIDEFGKSFYRTGMII